MRGPLLTYAPAAHHDPDVDVAARVVDPVSVAHVQVLVRPQQVAVQQAEQAAQRVGLDG